MTGLGQARPGTRVLVTGGCGYIGSVLCTRLSEAGISFVAVDNHSTSSRQHGPSAPCVSMDLRDTAGLAGVVGAFGPTAVVHLAAKKYTDESVRDPEGYWSNNLDSTLSLCTATREATVDRYLFLSSSAVYAEKESLSSGANNPPTPYGRGKVAAEWLIKDIVANAQSRSLVFRAFSVAGGSMAASQQHIFPVMGRSLLRAEPFIINGDDYATKDGYAVRDYVHVDDVVDALFLGLLTDQGPAELTVDLGTGSGHSVKEVVDAFSDRGLGRVKTSVVGRRRGDVAEILADPTAAHRHLGWVARRSLDDMVDDTLRSLGATKC